MPKPRLSCRRADPGSFIYSYAGHYVGRYGGDKPAESFTVPGLGIEARTFSQVAHLEAYLRVSLRHYRDRMKPNE
jgi:hypothetical protein